MQQTAYLGMGSNVGDRNSHIALATDMLGSVDEITVSEVSSLYETSPVGEVAEQEDFLNSAVEVRTRLKPLQLLHHCKRIEREIGRTSTVRHGPREIDIDILLFGDVEGTFSSDSGFGDGYTLVLPHPTLLERKFVLVPLLELDPQLVHPSGKPLAQALDHLEADDQKIEKAGVVVTGS